MFTPPSELLVAQPLSSPSQKLLGSYITQSRRLRSQSVPKSKYSEGGGLAAVTEFYGATGMLPLIIGRAACARLSSVTRQVHTKQQAYFGSLKFNTDLFSCMHVSPVI